MRSAAAPPFDVMIAGAGSVGMAAGFFLAKAGRKVLLLDPGDPPHGAGSHHGHTRLIRHAYGEGSAYVPLALHAHELWFDLERAVGVPVFIRSGIINAGPATDPFIVEVARSANEHGIELQRMDGAEANRRWPAWKMPLDYAVCFEPDAGVLLCENAVAGFRRLAKAHGADVRPNSTVTRIEADGDKAATAVLSSGESFTARHLIVCAGKATRDLVATLGLDLPVTRLRQAYAWFDASPQQHGPDVFPGFALLSENGFHYGVPNVDARGLKAGRHDAGRPVAADAPLEPFDAADQADIGAFLRWHLPGVGPLRKGETCEYDMTPDEHFVVDYLPGHPQVQVATGFSGHGFKFSCAIGEALAERVVLGECRADLSRFRISRFGAPQ